MGAAIFSSQLSVLSKFLVFFERRSLLQSMRPVYFFFFVGFGFSVFAYS